MDTIYENKTEEYNLKAFSLLKRPNEVKFNRKFILILKDQIIYIYNYESKSMLKGYIEPGKAINYFDFHCNNENIFYICVEYNAIIYEIANQKNNKLCEIEGHFSNIIYATFNPYKPNLFLTASKNNTIKIYDITNTLTMNLISLDISLDKDIIWDFNKIGFLTDENKVITYFDYMNFDKKKIKKYITCYIENFHFLNNDDSLIVITNDNIEFVENNIKIKNYKLNTKDDIVSTFYLREKEILIIIYQIEIKGFSINNKYEFKEIFKFNQSMNYYIYNPIYINENLLNKNEICAIYQFNNRKIISFSIFDKSIKQDDNKIENNFEKINIKEIKKNICDIPLIISCNNNDDYSRNCPKDKNYFNIVEIQNELESIKFRNLLERKKKVEEDINKFDDKDDIEKQYIFLLTLLINDNTNIYLLEKYLSFLKDNNTKLNDIFKKNYESYENELNYYSKALTIELNEKFYKNKIQSQKSEFLQLINDILKFNKDNDLKEFEKYLKECDNYFEKKISYFNMNINFSNEQLFYYRNINLLKYYFKTLYNELQKEEDIKIRNEMLKLELEKIQDNLNLCKNNFNSSTDVKKINSLIILLIFNSSQKEFISGYNLLNSAKGNIDNLIKYNDQNIIDFLKRFEHININLDLIKNFFKNILPLECFKSIYLTLYGKDEYYPFENEEFTNYFVENTFEVLEIPLENQLDISDKFSMKTYFIPFLSVISKKCSDSEKDIMRNGSFVKTGAHEVGHNFVNIKFFMENCRIPIETPRKKSLVSDDCEGGKYIEYALFGKTLEMINLNEALYILNENNYKKSFLEFQYGFKNIEEKNLKVKGVFENLCKGIQLNKNFITYAKSINLVEHSTHVKEKKILCRNLNDVIGRASPMKTYEKLLMEYFDN